MALGVTQYNPSAQSGDIKWDPNKMGVAVPGIGKTAEGLISNPSNQMAANYASYFDPNTNKLINPNSTPTINSANNLFPSQTNISPSSFDLNALLKVISSGSGSGSNNNAYNLGMAELAYKKQNDARQAAADLEALNFGRAKDTRILGGMENYYNTGSYGTGFDKLLNMIDAQGKISEKGVTDAYGRAVTNINEGYGAARGLGNAGYAALNEYLGQNPNNPYAGMQASVGSAPDALTQYLSAYGVSDQPVQGQIQADQLQAQQGVGNYQNLINILSGVAQSGASSRGAESAMGQNLFNTSLGQEQAGYKGAANNAQQQALNALQQQMFQSRFGVENDRNSLATQLQREIIAAGGKTNTPATNTTVTDPTTTTTGFTPSTSYDVNRPVPTVQQAKLIRNMPGQDPNELLQMLNARRGY